MKIAPALSKRAISTLSATSLGAILVSVAILATVYVEPRLGPRVGKGRILRVYRPNLPPGANRLMPMPVFSIKLDCPSTVRQSTTALLKVSLETIPLADLEPDQLAPTLQSPAFDINPATLSEFDKSGSIGWEWLATPKRLGDHQLLLTFPAIWVFLGDYFENKAGIHPLAQSKTPKGQVIVIPLNVTNELGLTAVQDALLKAFGAVVGIIGTIFGYPFWKRFLELKFDSSPSGPITAQKVVVAGSPAQPSPSQQGSIGSRRRGANQKKR